MINSHFPSSLETNKEAYNKVFGKSIRVGLPPIIGNRPTVIREHTKCHFPTLCHITLIGWGTPAPCFGEVKNWTEGTPMTRKHVISGDVDMSVIVIRTNPLYEYNARRI